MKEAIIAGVVSTIISSIILGIGTWYLNGLNDAVSLGFKIRQLEADQAKVVEKFDRLSEKVNEIGELYARLDERLAGLVRYNDRALDQISNNKKIPQMKVDSAKQYLNTLPSNKDAMNYLEMNLGFSPEEAKAVVAPPQSDSKKMLKVND